MSEFILAIIILYVWLILNRRLKKENKYFKEIIKILGPNKLEFSLTSMYNTAIREIIFPEVKTVLDFYKDLFMDMFLYTSSLEHPTRIREDLEKEFNKKFNYIYMKSIKKYGSDILTNFFHITEEVNKEKRERLIRKIIEVYSSDKIYSKDTKVMDLIVKHYDLIIDNVIISMKNMKNIMEFK